MTPLEPGVYTALVTPFDDKGQLDTPLLARLLAFQESAGVQGVVVAGSTGEGVSLSAPEKIALYELAVQTRGNLRVIAGVIVCSLEEAHYLMRQAHRAGCDGVMLAPPFYYRAPLKGLIGYFRTLLSASRLPVILYNIPQLTRTPLPSELVEALLEEPNLVGIKDSSGDPESLRAYLRFVPRLKVWVGEEKLLSACLQGGGAGTISGLANVFPYHLVRVYRAFCEGKDPAGSQQLVDAVADAIDAFPAPANFKYALTHHGFPLSPVRLPLMNLDDAQQQAVDALMHQLP